ncbi:MAG: VIT1/CCC1 transporter family protein [Candidatus Omnitrophota bacterium]|nr:VIT1/CCC1 transporter family protein [Candidatus Omnitrophota bacterium]
MKHSLKIGLSFGLNSGIITTLGLIVGLDSGTHSKTVVIGGILTLAVADAFSDALGIHISEESENKHTEKEIWESTIFTFLAKFIFTLIFIIPVLLFSLEKAITVSVAWGLTVLALFSFLMAKEQKTNPYKVVIEHLFIALIVIAITHYVGDWVRIKYG